MRDFVFGRALYWITKRSGYGTHELNPPRSFIHFLRSYYAGANLTGAEIGVASGDNAKNILEQLNIQLLYLIDLWEPYSGYSERRDHSSEYEEMLKKLSKHKDRLKILRMKSSEAVDNIEDESLDFVYIDANHNYEYVKEDLYNYWRKLKRGGVLAGHDFNWYGVARAVIEFCDELGKVPITGNEDTDWWIEKEVR